MHLRLIIILICIVLFSPAFSQTVKTEAPAADAGLQLYAQYDFIPGEKIIYSNDFSSEQAGEMPGGWNSNGTAAVTSINGLAGKWVMLNQNSFYLTDNKDVFKGNFTVEFDLVMHRSNPKAAFPMIVFGLLASGSYSPVANELLKGQAAAFTTALKIQPYDRSGSYLHLQTFSGRTNHLTTDIKKLDELPQYFNQVIHVAIQVQNERMRTWFNEKKMYDLPKAINPGSLINQLYFDVKRYGGPDTEVGYAISNIKIAKGLPDARHKLAVEGRFSTTGILFDANTAAIKPGSNGVLQEIAGILKKDLSMRLKITGHTDSDGAETANLLLSQKRADAVKQALVKSFGIEADRLETDGKGESVPVSENNTPKGKAQNRRVEFEKR